jgi:hypothetical protein
MARAGRPWAVVITAVVCALVAAGALAVAASLRHRDAAGADQDGATTQTSSSGAGVDGCLIDPCKVLATTNVGGTTVDLVADKGFRSGRVRIGGRDGSSEVVEASITNMGAQLGPESLQCFAGIPAACLLKGQNPQGVVGQVIVGRSAKWSELGQPFQSDAGYLGLADVTGKEVGPEILVAQHDCVPAKVADCSSTPVYVRIYSLRSAEMGCTRMYARLESLPGWPAVTLDSQDIGTCPQH